MEFSEEAFKEATLLKDEGNKLLLEKKFALAAEKYSEAIEKQPHAIFYR